jgi:hypothetical protein
MMRGFWNTVEPTVLQQWVSRLAAYLHYESDDHWDHTKTEEGAILSVRWPTSRYTSRFKERRGRLERVEDPT